MVLGVQECPSGHNEQLILTGLLSEIPMPLNMSRMDRNSIVGRGGQESPNAYPIS